MDIIEVVRADLKGASMERQREVADGAGIPWATLRKIVDGDTDNPRYITVRRLWAWYEAHPFAGQQPPTQGAAA